MKGFALADDETNGQKFAVLDLQTDGMRFSRQFENAVRGERLSRLQQRIEGDFGAVQDGIEAPPLGIDKIHVFRY